MSLLKQIEEVRDKGYSDKETNVVLPAITPGLYLRNVLKTTKNLTFSRLIKFFKSRFSSIIKGSQETATHFVYRAMSFRQKLIVFSKYPITEKNYDQDLCQRLFLKSLQIGLTTETIMTEIKLILRNLSVLDEDRYMNIRCRVGQASSSDQQRSVKMNKSETRPRVNAVEMKYETEKELN